MSASKLVQKCLCVMLTFVVFFAGCGGHTANPVDRYMLGDEKKSCNALYAEMSGMDKDTVLKNRQKDSRDVWNVVFFVSGFLIIVPWFFIDLKGSQEVELEALQARKKALQIIFNEKNCTPPEIKPTEDKPKGQTKLPEGRDITQVLSFLSRPIARTQFEPSVGA